MFGRRLSILIGTLVLSVVAARVAPAQVTSQSELGTEKLPAGFIKEFGTMWTFEAPPLDYWKARYGFTPDQQWLDHVRLASMRLPGCSSSFVSSHGLVMTNHHCARECITAVSTPDSTSRSSASTRRPRPTSKCPGLYVDQLQASRTSPPKCRRPSPPPAPAQQVAQRNAAIASWRRPARPRTDVQCQVVTFYQGGAYSLYRFKRYTDVRLVFAPEEEIASSAATRTTSPIPATTSTQLLPGLRERPALQAQALPEVEPAKARRRTTSSSSPETRAPPAAC